MLKYLAMKYCVLIFILFFAPIVAEKGKLIVIYGTPCSGKSTLTNELETHLSGNFRVIKRTETVQHLRTIYIEKLTGQKDLPYNEVKRIDYTLKHKRTDFKEKALDQMITDLEKRLEVGENIIFDACLERTDQLEKLSHLKPIYVLVYAPLPDLSVREQERSLKRKRTLYQQEQSRKNILIGFSKLYIPVKPEKSYSSLSKNDVVDYYLKTRNRWVDDDFSRSAQKIITDFHLKSEGYTSFAPRKKPTVFIDTSKMTPSESVRLIKNWI